MGGAKLSPGRSFFAQSQRAWHTCDKAAAGAHLGKANLDTTVANVQNLLRSRCPQISKSECRKQARGGGVHIGAVPGGQKIHQCGIFGFCNEPHVRVAPICTLYMSDSARKNYMYFFDMIMRAGRASSWVALNFRQAVVFWRSPNGPGTLVTKPQPVRIWAKPTWLYGIEYVENLLRSGAPTDRSI